jgi:hypothetical protein
MKANLFKPLGIEKANGDEMPIVNRQTLLKGTVIISRPVRTFGKDHGATSTFGIALRCMKETKHPSIELGPFSGPRMEYELISLVVSITSPRAACTSL